MYALALENPSKCLAWARRKGVGAERMKPTCHPAGIYQDACFTIYSDRFHHGMQRLAHHSCPFRKHRNQLIRSRHHPLRIMGRSSCKEHTRRSAVWSAIAAQRGLAVLSYRDGPYLLLSILPLDKSENSKALKGFS